MQELMMQSMQPKLQSLFSMSKSIGMLDRTISYSLQFIGLPF